MATLAPASRLPTFTRVVYRWLLESAVLRGADGRFLSSACAGACPKHRFKHWKQGTAGMRLLPPETFPAGIVPRSCRRCPGIDRDVVGLRGCTHGPQRPAKPHESPLVS